jgi:hypothetical protein
MLREMRNVPAWRSTSLHRRADNSALRAPVSAASITSAARIGIRASAASTSRRTSAAVGGTIAGVCTGGGLALSGHVRRDPLPPDRLPERPGQHHVHPVKAGYRRGSGTPGTREKRRSAPPGQLSRSDYRAHVPLFEAGGS